MLRRRATLDSSTEAYVFFSDCNETDSVIKVKIIRFNFNLRFLLVQGRKVLARDLAQIWHRVGTFVSCI